ncbi:hypothetical protein BTJ49_15280 [Oleiagrimonas sp. MCCC 1A03011]|nr:hypothetical protein BTJ49_15280 [Oleiagrimonas sp. MCCC 1A03011]
MIEIAIRVAFGVAFLATLVYQFAFFKFYRIVKAERVDWISRRGSLSFMYAGLPRALDPNVGIALLGVAFSSRVSQLRTHSARTYAFYIRVCLPLGLLLYLGISAVQILGAA